MKRWFSLALVLAMCFTTVLGDITTAFADDEEIVVCEAVDAIESFETSENGTGDNANEYSEDNWLPVEDENTSDAGTTETDVLSIADNSAEPYEGSASNDTEDYTQDTYAMIEDGSDVENSVPELWYARANTSLALEIEENVSRNIPEGSILLVIEKVGEPLLHVVCENLSGTVSASALDALTDEEVQSFMDELTAQGEVSLYQDNPDYPLPHEPAEAQAEQTVAPEEADSEDQVADNASEEQTQNEDATASENAGNPENSDNTESKEDVQISDKTEDNKDTDNVENAENGEDTEKSEDAGSTESTEQSEDAESTEDGEKSEDTEKPETGENDAAAEDATQPIQDEADTANRETASYEAGAPVSIAMNLTSVVLGVKESFTGLTATVVDGNGIAVDGQTVSWRTSNKNVVKVNAAGKLTAVRRGKATIIASVEGLPEATVSVIVRKAPSKVTLKPKKANISIGMGLQLTAKLNKGTASGKLTYTSSNPGVAVVDENGLVTGVGLGKATITVRTYNKKKATCKVSVFSAPASVSTDKPSYEILQGGKGKIVIGVLDGAGLKTYANLNVVSSDPNCVTVDGNGKLVGVNYGTATITITTHNGLSTACTVSVCGLPADMTLSAGTITIGVKEKYKRMSYTLIPPAGQDKCAATVKWKSRNKKIAKVNSKTGVITGVKAGTTTIVATTNNKISRSVKVVVKKAPKSVSLSPKELALTVGMSGQLTSSYNAKNVNDNVTYASSDPNIAVVNENGVVTAVGRGSAVVTVQTYNGKKDTCTVNVYNDPTQVMVTESITVAVGATAQLTCSVVDAEGQPSTANYSYTAISESGSVAVDGNGRVTGLSIGTARVRVSTHNGITTHMDGSGLPVETECLVTIVEAPPVRYRMFAAYCFYNVPQKGSLTFPMNNATSFQQVLSTSSIDGKQYENVGILENPSKDGLLSGLVNAFADSRDSDINVVYLCSHGTNYVNVAKTAKSTHYGLQLPGYVNYKSSSEYYITSEEIFNAISTIRGQVILVLDSCYSGQFITNMKSALNNAGGRISVMTAATNTTACYYNIANTATACDFFTMYLLIGAGYNMRSHTYSGAYPADTNQDGKLTFNELFNYAKKNVKANVPKYKNKSWFHGNYKQTPNVFKGNNGDLVLFQYA